MNKLDPSRGAAPRAAAVRRTLTRDRKRPEDTPQGCRALAQADLRRAAEMTGGHMRQRHEHSATAWTARAELLDRLEASFQARIRRRSA